MASYSSSIVILLLRSQIVGYNIVGYMMIYDNLNLDIWAVLTSWDEEWSFCLEPE